MRLLGEQPMIIANRRAGPLRRWRLQSPEEVAAPLLHGESRGHLASDAIALGYKHRDDAEQAQQEEDVESVLDRDHVAHVSELRVNGGEQHGARQRGRDRHCDLLLHQRRREMQGREHDQAHQAKRKQSFRKGRENAPTQLDRDIEA